MGVSHANNGKSHAGSSALPPDPILFGRSPVMAGIRKRIEKVFATNVPLLIYGQGGSGKEVLARWI